MFTCTLHAKLKLACQLEVEVLLLHVGTVMGKLLCSVVTIEIVNTI